MEFLRNVFTLLDLTIFSGNLNLFYNYRDRKDCFRLPNLKVNNSKIKNKKSKKFLRALLDENLTWKEYLKYIKNKYAKNIDRLYKAKH